MKPLPPNCFLHDCEPAGARGGQKRWRDRSLKRIYTWDGLHGEVEVFDERGLHIGVADPVTGDRIKPAVRGRSINV